MTDRALGPRDRALGSRVGALAMQAVASSAKARALGSQAEARGTNPRVLAERYGFKSCTRTTPFDAAALAAIVAATASSGAKARTSVRAEAIRSRS